MPALITTSFIKELKDIYRRAEITLWHYKITKLANTNFCVTEFDTGHIVETHNDNIRQDLQIFA